jgi:uncharacterized membrane protein YgcG
MLRKFFILVIFCALSLQACGDISSNDTLLYQKEAITDNSSSSALPSFRVFSVDAWPAYHTFLGSDVITDSLEKNEWCIIVNVLSVLRNGKRDQDYGGVWYGIPENWSVKTQVIRGSDSSIPNVTGVYTDGGEISVFKKYSELPQNLNGILHSDYDHWFGTHITEFNENTNMFTRNIFVLGMNVVSNTEFRDRFAYEVIHSYGLSQKDETALFDLLKRAKAGCHRKAPNRPNVSNPTTNPGTDGGTSGSAGGPVGGGGTGGGPSGGGSSGGSGGPVGGGGTP